MIRISKRSLLALLLALTMILAVSACQKRDPVGEGSLSESQGSEGDALSALPGFVNPLPVPDGPGEMPTELEAYSERAAEKHAINSDTVGWLYVPGTSINDVVMWYPNDYNEFYLRKDFDKRYSWEGSYFADFRNKWNGGREGISKNIVIYGHSMKDDPNEPLFSQLKKLLSEDYAKKTPYLYFSTPDEDMVWEIFSVFYSTIYEPYNTPDPVDAAAYEAIIKDCRERSIYNYDTTVTADDNIITLSTCCYNYTASYPNDYRYIIMAKLVEKNATLRDEAAFTVNPSPKQPK